MNEMAELAASFEWAAATNIEALRRAVRAASFSPLRAVGSGGSLTAAQALADLHRSFTGRLAAVATPLEAAGELLDPAVSTWLLSAGGGNVDILAAARALVAHEPRQLAVICGREASPLARVCRQHPFVDLLLYPPPGGKDGFLATNSLVVFITLLTRAYATEFGRTESWAEIEAAVRPLMLEEGPEATAWQAATAHLWDRPTTLVLHGPSARVGAVDLESKFTEAAIGNLQMADYRNFAHGRHHWLAKRGQQTGVLAFITEADKALATRTLKLIPPDIPCARIVLPGDAGAAPLGSLAAALRISGWAGERRGIDPGRPGVPEFGRRLYSMPLPRARTKPDAKTLSARSLAALARKSGLGVDRLPMCGEFDRWKAALDGFLARLNGARFGGVVLDYDGTIVDTRARFQPASQEMGQALTRLLKGGTRIAIATGRGQSVRRDLQQRIPEALWPQVLVGYYNGAEIAALDDGGAPDGSPIVCATLEPLAQALRAQPELAACARQEDRPRQITLEATRMIPEGRLWSLAHQVILKVGAEGVTVTRSSHSVDIVSEGTSKLTVVRRLRELVGDAPVLTIGDRGLWPGNDYELLREPFSLGVDELSVDPDTCWHLGAPGQRGPVVTLDYLSELEPVDGGLRFRPGWFQ
jgi:hydroxymethylpyrimidine pyrophosphatase-like HAD family hydrolase/fructoselysine-6-P-deglycase FrlB-like protein